MAGSFFRLIFLISLFFCPQMGMKAQEVMLEMDSHNSVITKKAGLNHKSFGYLFFDYEVYAFKSATDLDVVAFKSRNFSIGYKRIFRLTDIYSVGGSLSFLNDSYTIRQGASKTFPASQTHESERVLTYNLSGEFYNRFILKKDYDHLGIYFDLGVYGSFAAGSRHLMFDTVTDPGLQGKTQELKVKGLKYIEPFTGGLSFRLGLNRIAVVVHHRLSNWLKPSYGFAQPPKTSVGLELSIY